MKVAPTLREDVGGEGRDFDTLRSFDRPIGREIKVNEVIDGNDINEVLHTDVNGKGTQWVELHDGLEAEVAEVGISRYKVVEVMRVQRSID